MSDWKDLFQEHILARGEAYYFDGAVLELHKTEHGYHAVVEGTEDYEVDIEMEGGRVCEMYCSCPYAEDGNNCKHMAAVLFEIEEQNEEDILTEETCPDDQEQEEPVRRGDCRARSSGPVNQTIYSSGSLFLCEPSCSCWRRISARYLVMSHVFLMSSWYGLFACFSIVRWRRPTVNSWVVREKYSFLSVYLSSFRGRRYRLALWFSVHASVPGLSLNVSGAHDVRLRRANWYSVRPGKIGWLYGESISFGERPGNGALCSAEVRASRRIEISSIFSERMHDNDSIIERN